MLVFIYVNKVHFTPCCKVYSEKLHTSTLHKVVRVSVVTRITCSVGGVDGAQHRKKTLAGEVRFVRSPHSRSGTCKTLCILDVNQRNV